MGDANEALFGGGSGAPGYKFTTPGDTVSGYITHLDSVHDRDYKTKELKYWPSGDKLLIALVTVQTDLRDPSVPEDDGQRTVWIRGRNATGAVKDAVKAAGKRKLEEGGRFMLKFTGLGQAEKGNQPPKLFEARYAAPTAEGLAVYEAARARSGGGQRQANDDPWANADPDPGFINTGSAPAASPAAAPASDPWATTPPQSPQPVQEPLAATATPPSGDMIRLPSGDMVDTTGMSAEAIALLQKMGQPA